MEKPIDELKLGKYQCKNESFTQVFYIVISG